MEREKKKPPQGLAETAKYIVGIEGSFSDHLKSRLHPALIAKEVVNHVTEKIIPQGCDEVVNALWTGSAYLPWPNSSGPGPVEGFAFNPESADHGRDEYADRLNQIADRGSDTDERGMER